MEPCIHESMDYGRSSSACGVELGGVYADTVELIYDHELYDVPGWLTVAATLNPLMSSEEQCQHLCAAHPNCDFFSYEFELLESEADGLYGHECFLKAAYVGCTADDTDSMAGYGAWTSEDPGWVGHSGPEVCPGDQQAVSDRSCLLTGMDYGGGPHECGYATTIVIYSDNSAFPAPGWYSGPVKYNTLLVDAGACQDLCEATPGCDFFSYEWEETDAIRYHECYLKQGFSHDECPHPVIEQYVPWSNEDDPAWHGVSGPAVCTPTPPPPLAPFAVSFSLTASGDVGDYTPTVMDAMATKVATTAGVDKSMVDIEVTAGSVNIKFTIKAATVAAATAAGAAVQTSVASVAAATTFFSTVPGITITVASVTAISAVTAPSLQPGLIWEYETFGTIITHECGLGACLAETEFLAEEIQSAACSGSYSHKVTLVLDGGNIDDGTFNQLAYEGAAASCTAEADCCLEVDRVDDDTEIAEESFFCELEYAATDSDLTIGIGFLHEQSVHRAATCMPNKDFGIIDVAYTASLPNLEGLTFADDQAGYLAGVIAGGVSATGSRKVGVIGGLPILPVKRFISGFANGVAYSCSNCTTTIIYCPFGDAAEATTGLSCPGDFADPAFGVGVAQYLIGLGADVIFGAGGLTGSAGITYAAAPVGTTISITGATSFSGSKAETSAPYVVGVDNDEYYTTFGSGSTPGADKLITSALKKVDAGVSLAVSSYFAGTGTGSNVLLDASNGGVGFAPAHEADSFVPYLGPVTPAITAAATTVFAQMSLGQFNTYVDSNGDLLPISPSLISPPPDVDSASDNNVAIVSGVLGGVLGFLLLFACVAIFRLVSLEKNGQPAFSPRVKKFSGIEVAGISTTADPAATSASSTEDKV